MRLKTKWFRLTAVIIVAACGDQMSGTYGDDAGVTYYTFASNGAVRISVLGTNVGAEYRLEGNKVLVSNAQGTVVLTRRDGHLYGPMGLKLVRQRNSKGE